MAPKAVLIRKYENRRLYDTTNSRYVNLDEVAQMLQHGDDVRVVDAASGEDITRLILTQIIVEGAKTPDSGFPLDILRQMVIASGLASQESAMRYTRAMLDLYKSTYRMMSPALNPFDFMPNPPATATAPVEYSESVSATAESAAGTPPKAEGADDVAALKRRVAELEKLVSSAGLGRSSRKRTPRKAASRKK